MGRLADDGVCKTAVLNIGLRVTREAKASRILPKAKGIPSSVVHSLLSFVDPRPLIASELVAGVIWGGLLSGAVLKRL